MKKRTLLLAPLAGVISLLMSACSGPDRGPGFGPGAPPPPSVSMPFNLSERERVFIPELEASLQRNGLMPVYTGAGQMRLDFLIEEGPINVDTSIRLSERGGLLAEGRGRDSGSRLLTNRARVADNSFHRALREFEAQLGRTRFGSTF